MSDAVSIITAVCTEMNADGHVSSPRIVRTADFDPKGFISQKSDFPGVELEWVRQSGPGMWGDDFAGTLAVPIDAYRLFLVDYQT